MDRKIMALVLIGSILMCGCGKKEEAPYVRDELVKEVETIIEEISKDVETVSQEEVAESAKTVIESMISSYHNPTEEVSSETDEDEETTETMIESEIERTDPFHIDDDMTDFAMSYLVQSFDDRVALDGNEIACQFLGVVPNIFEVDSYVDIEKDHQVQIYGVDTRYRLWLYDTYGWKEPPDLDIMGLYNCEFYMEPRSDEELLSLYDNLNSYLFNKQIPSLPFYHTNEDDNIQEYMYIVSEDSRGLYNVVELTTSDYYITDNTYGHLVYVSSKWVKDWEWEAEFLIAAEQDWIVGLD